MTVSGSGISWAICKSVPRSRQITMPAPHHSVFYRPISISVFCIFSFSVSGNVTVLPSTVTFMHISVCMQCAVRVLPHSECFCIDILDQCYRYRCLQLFTRIRNNGRLPYFLQNQNSVVLFNFCVQLFSLFCVNKLHMLIFIGFGSSVVNITDCIISKHRRSYITFSVTIAVTVAAVRRGGRSV